MTFAGTFGERWLRENLRRGDYTRWAFDLAPRHLRGVLWLAGEFRVRGHGLMELFDRHPEAVTTSSNDSAFATAALRCLLCDDRYDAVEARRRFTRGRAEMQFADVPDTVRMAVTSIVPAANWETARISEYGYDVAGSLKNGDRVHAKVNCASEPVVRLPVEGRQVPAVVLGAVERKFPDLQVLASYQSASAMDYEIVVWTPRGESVDRIVVRADGQEISPVRRVDGREPVFSQAFRRKLDFGKYTRWASDYSAASLGGVLWLLGAVATEVLPKLRPVGAYVDLTPWPQGELRPRFALDAIYRVVTQGEPFEAERMGNLIVSGEEAFARHCRKSVPFSVRRALEVILPKAMRARVSGVQKKAEGYQFHGADDRRQWAFTVTVAADGASASVCRPVVESELPEAVLAQFQARGPQTPVGRTISAIGPNWADIERYRCSFLKRDTPSVTIRKDGTHVDDE